MLSIIGAGPGDPELLTLKAVRLIRQADIIALIDAGSGHSVLENTLGELIEGKPLLCLPMPMRGALEDWKSAHRHAVSLLKAPLTEGLDVALPVLGDPMLYATASYLMALLKDAFDLQVVPGISAPFAAAAAARIPLAQGDDTLTIRAGFEPGDTLPEGAVVIMKAAGALKAIGEAARGRPAMVFCDLGMPGERIVPLEQAPENPGYFTTVIVCRGS